MQHNIFFFTWQYYNYIRLLRIYEKYLSTNQSLILFNIKKQYRRRCKHWYFYFHLSVQKIFIRPETDVLNDRYHCLKLRRNFLQGIILYYWKLARQNWWFPLFLFVGFRSWLVYSCYQIMVKGYFCFVLSYEKHSFLK